MLVNLHVKNLALIEEIEVDFTNGLNILTGETGAGKSIIIGSVNLALGGKMSKEMIREHTKYALVELVFHVENPIILNKLKSQDIIAEDGQIIITRKMTGTRSISKINGETCTVSQIKAIASYLLDIHGQNEHQSLLYNKRQLAILDEYGKDRIERQKADVKEAFQVSSELKKSLDSYQLDHEQRKREISFLEFEVKEILDAQLQKDEDFVLEKQYRKLVNSKKIVETLIQVKAYTGYDGGSGGEEIGRGLHELQQVSQLDEKLDDLGKTLTDIDSLLNDFNRELSAYLSELTFSNAEFSKIEQRLDQINHLKTKYGNSIDEILENLHSKQEKLDQLYHFEAYKEKVAREYQTAHEKLKEEAHKLSDIRKNYGDALADNIRKGLMDLNFLDVIFEIRFLEMKQISANGYDEIEFLISTNPGELLKPLDKVVSGGELSRIMLAIKTLLADKDETETLIFDEIDTGISGRTAQMVSEKMALIGRNHQVLCITHLPQIAAMADTHYAIIKNVSNMETTTTIQSLSNNESIEELARLLGGARITDAVLKSAGEMKELAQVQKNSRLK